MTKDSAAQSNFASALPAAFTRKEHENSRKNPLQRKDRRKRNIPCEQFVRSVAEVPFLEGAKLGTGRMQCVSS